MNIRYRTIIYNSSSIKIYRYLGNRFRKRTSKVRENKSRHIRANYPIGLLVDEKAGRRITKDTKFINHRGLKSFKDRIRNIHNEKL